MVKDISALYGFDKGKTQRALRAMAVMYREQAECDDNTSTTRLFASHMADAYEAALREVINGQE